MTRVGLRFILTGLVLVVLSITVLSTNSTVAQALERGYLAYTGDQDEWAANVARGAFYSVWIRADDQWVDFDLYVYDGQGNLVCSSVGPGGVEVCVFYAWQNTYHIKVVSVGGCPPQTVKERPCGEGWYTLGA